jgi:quinol monooxygenase YgiN
LAFIGPQIATITMSIYGYIGKFKAKPGNGTKLAAILIGASRLVEKMDSCQSYIVGIDSNDRDLIVVTEVWNSKADHDASLQAEDVRTLISKAIP